MRYLTWSDVFVMLEQLADRLKLLGFHHVYGIPRGGAVVAGLLMAHQQGLTAVDDRNEADVIVDDIIDSGATAKRWKAVTGKDVLSLAESVGEWTVFPWESRDTTADLEDTVIRQLEFVGEDPTREGLQDTPKRVIKALAEMTEGYRQDPATILSTVFSTTSDEMVVVSDIDFASLCEHHMLPFTGKVVVGYVPQNGRVVGLSKIPRIVHCFARRLQIQESMTQQIAAAMVEHLNPLGVGVVVTGAHTCCQLRGARSANVMTTSSLLGVFRTDAMVRNEFLSLTRR